MLRLTRAGSFTKIFQFAIVAVACAFGASALHAQGTAAGSATGTKIGVINVRQAIASTAEGKQAGAELQSQFAPRQSELEGLNKQINDLRSRMEAGSKLSPEEQTRLQREGEAAVDGSAASNSFVLTPRSCTPGRFVFAQHFLTGALNQRRTDREWSRLYEGLRAT